MVSAIFLVSARFGSVLVSVQILDARVPQKWYVYGYVTGVHAKTNYTLNTNFVAHNLVISEIWKGMMGSQIYSSLILSKYVNKIGKKGKKLLR